MTYSEKDISTNYVSEYKKLLDSIEKANIKGNVKSLKTRFGSGVVVTATIKNKLREHEISKDKLCKGEVAAVSYFIGPYVIRDSIMLYKDDGDIHYTDRIPAEEKDVEEFREGQSVPRLLLGLGFDKPYRPVRVIHARYRNDASAKWHYICGATEAKSMIWSESISFIGTAKKNVFDSDKKSDLFVLVEYTGDSFSTETWHRFNPDGETKEYYLHPYDEDYQDKHWEW